MAKGDGVEVWAAALDGERPTWSLLTLGPGARGCELSLALLRHPDETAPAPWAVETLTHLARAHDDAERPSPTVVLESPRPETPGGAPTALAFTADAAFGALEGVPVWQVVPLQRDEARLVREWCPSGLLEVLRQVDPQLVADPERPSLLQSPRARQAIEARVTREGSSLGLMRARVSTLTKAKAAITWRLSSEAVEGVVALLKGRTAHQRPFVVQGPGRGVEVRPDVSTGAGEGGAAVLHLSQTASRQVRARLRARPGRYAFEALPDFTIEVV